MESLAVPALKAVQVAPHPDLGAEETTARLVPVVMMTVLVFVGMMSVLGVRHGLVEMMIDLLVPVVTMPVLVFVGMMSVRHVRGVTMPARVVPAPLRSNVRTKFDTRAAVAA